MGACVVVAATVPAAAVHCGCCSELGACAGGADQVAEMTGRSGRIVRKGNRGVCYEQRGAKEDDREKLNVNECQRFQNGVLPSDWMTSFLNEWFAQRRNL